MNADAFGLTCEMPHPCETTAGVGYWLLAQSVYNALKHTALWRSS